MRRKKKSNILLIILSLLSTAIIAYAMLTTNFNINGSTQIIALNWDIHYENLRINTDSVLPKVDDRTPTIEDGSTATTTLELDVGLLEPGDFYEFTVDVVNAGNIDAQIGQLNIEPVLTEDEKRVIDFEIKYPSIDREIALNDFLAKGTRETIKVRIALRDDFDYTDTTILPVTGISKSVSIDIRYIQANGTQQELGFRLNHILEKANPATVTSYTAGNTSEMYTFEQPAASQLDATTDYRYIGETHCSYDDGAYWVPQRAGGACAKVYKKNASGTITYEASCTEDGDTTCTQLSGTLKEIKNYIRYNDEMWRIIGVFDGKLKIIKDVEIGNYSYDNKQSNEGSSDRNRGSNDWSDSQLMYFLNKGNYGKTTYSKVGNFIYDDKDPANLIYEIGKVRVKISSSSYVWQENSWKLNDTAWSQAVVEKYYLGAAYNAANSAEAKYIGERSNARPGASSARPTNWTGKVGLMYPSDYSYTFAKRVNDQCYTTPSKCNTAPGNMYTSWLARNDTNQWTITPHSDGGDQKSYTWRIMPSGSVYSYYCDMEYAVRPVVYLDSELWFKGEGTSSKPYEII